MPDLALAIFCLFLFPAGDKAENPWIAKVEPAVSRAEREGTSGAYMAAFDAAYRADDWRAGLKLARAALEKHPKDEPLRGSIVRALWRAGKIEEAERLFAQISTKTTERVALQMGVIIHSSRGEPDSAADAGRRLEKLPDLSAAELFHVVTSRIGSNQLSGLVDLIRRAQKLADSANGYPETYIEDELGGVADFLEAVGEKPMNQITKYGEAHMRAAALINLPYCDVMINGHGPYKLIVDTGGSVMVALDKTVADEVGIKVIAQASVRGVGGKEDSGQALIDELRIGGIRCERVMTRVLDMHKAVANMADGIVGTGVFADERMTLDFESERLVVEKSSERPAAGSELKLRLIGDAKLVVPAKVNGEEVLTIWDSGADVAALSPSKLEELFPNRHIPTFHAAAALGVGAESAPKISMGPGVDMQIGTRTYKDFSGIGLDVLDTILSPLLMTQSDVLVGMPVFRDTRKITIDFAKCKMWADWAPRE